MIKIIKIAIFVFLLGGFIMCSAQNLKNSAVDQSTNNLNNEVNTEQTACTKNADCVLVNKECCGCGSGGESIAVHISQKDSYNNKLDKQCDDIEKKFGPLTCHDTMRCDEFQAQCRNSKCIAEKKGQNPPIIKNLSDCVDNYVKNNQTDCRFRCIIKGSTSCTQAYKKCLEKETGQKICE